MLHYKKYLLAILISIFVALSVSTYAMEFADKPIAADNLKRLKTILKFPFYPQNYIGFNLSDMISSRYGMRFHPVLGSSRFHNGIDIRMRYEPIRSVLLGKITVTGYNEISGYYIIVEHLNDLITSYAHLSKIKCEVGDIVLPGQEIGISGDSGRTTGPHLHFVVKYKGKAIDPMNLLNIMLGEYSVHEK